MGPCTEGNNKENHLIAMGSERSTSSASPTFSLLSEHFLLTVVCKIVQNRGPSFLPRTDIFLKSFVLAPKTSNYLEVVTFIH